MIRQGFRLGKLWTIVVAVLAAGLLAGCGTQPLVPASTPPRDAAGGGAGASPEPAPAPGVAAAQSLLQQSTAASAAGRYGEARALLERALRIEPNNPRVWLALGELELASGNAAQARAMAQKALSLAGRDAALASSAQRLLRAAGG